MRHLPEHQVSGWQNVAGGEDLQQHRPVRQIGYVVNDLDRAVHGWLELGVGPWFVMRDLPMRALYRGKPCETPLSVAWANSGEMQIGVIQQLDNTAAQPRAQGQPVERQLRRSSV